MGELQSKYPTINLSDPRQDVHSVRSHNPFLRRYSTAEKMLPDRRIGAKALELGGGTGEFSRRLSNAGFAVTFVDYSEHNLARASDAGYETARLDLNKGLPVFEDESFDLVVMLEVIEHLVAAEFILAECYRVVRPGGFVIVSTPNFAYLFNRLRILAGNLSKDEGYHYRFFTPAVLEARLTAAGFDIDTTNHSTPAIGVNMVRNKLLGKNRLHVDVPRWLSPLFARQLMVRAVRTSRTNG